MISYRYFHDIRLSELQAAIITFGMIMEIQYMGLKEYAKHIINSDFSVRFSHILARNFSWHFKQLVFPSILEAGRAFCGKLFPLRFRSVTAKVLFCRGFLSQLNYS
jgi:hypothetical protein